MDLGKKINNFRLIKNISVEELAKELNLSPELVEAWENGSQEPSASQLVKLAQYFNTSVDTLLGTTKEKAPFNPLLAFALPNMDFTKKAPTKDADTDLDDQLVKEMIELTAAIDLKRKKDKSKGD